jgi:hypothetical protein
MTAAAGKAAGRPLRMEIGWDGLLQGPAEHAQDVSPWKSTTTRRPRHHTGGSRTTPPGW